MHAEAGLSEKQKAEVRQMVEYALIGFKATFKNELRFITDILKVTNQKIEELTPKPPPIKPAKSPASHNKTRLPENSPKSWSIRQPTTGSPKSTMYERTAGARRINSDKTWKHKANRLNRSMIETKGSPMAFSESEKRIEIIDANGDEMEGKKMMSRSLIQLQEQDETEENDAEEEAGKMNKNMKAKSQSTLKVMHQKVNI